MPRTIPGVKKTSQCIAYSGCLEAFGLNFVEEPDLRKAAWVMEALFGACGIPGLVWGSERLLGESGL